MPSRKLYRLLLDFCSEKAYSLLGRRERSKKGKFLPLAFSNYTPFLHKTQGASVNFSFGGRIARTESIAPQGALLKKASLLDNLACFGVNLNNRLSMTL